MKTGYKNMKCGLIGERLGHSFSPLIHSELADYSYELCEVEPSKLEAFVREGRLDAFNVTIPYKKDIIPFLDEISPEARAIGAVNTVVRESSGKLCGYNTDYFGFKYMIERADIDVKGKKAIVFGTGGASLTVCAVLKDKGAQDIAVIGRKDNTPENIAKHADAHIIVNATPVGMYPNNARTPVDVSLFPVCECVLDVIYNPARTKLMLDAEKRGIKAVNGLPMLVAQAVRAFEFFTNDTAKEGCIEHITSHIAQANKNIILIGMPGCGKSTVGKLIAERLGRDFFDADIEFEKMHGFTPAHCIETFGEDRFRELENVTVCELGKKSGVVIATGGGVVTRRMNYDPLHQNGEIFFIERKLENLSVAGRPLSQKTSPKEMYKNRIGYYREFADATVESREIPEDTSERIIAAYKKLTQI